VPSIAPFCGLYQANGCESRHDLVHSISNRRSRKGAAGGNEIAYHRERDQEIFWADEAQHLDPREESKADTHKAQRRKGCYQNNDLVCNIFLGHLSQLLRRDLWKCIHSDERCVRRALQQDVLHTGRVLDKA
jgi:hypothetical protein